MKPYKKPKIEFNAMALNEKITSLTNWLEGAGAEYAQAGISTYILQS